MVQQGHPEFCFLCVCVPGVDVVVHDLTEVGQLGKVEAALDRLLKGVPRAVKVVIQITTGMAAHHGDAQTGDELGQRAMAALFNGCLHSLEGLDAKAIGCDDRRPMLLQLIEVTEVFYPAMTDQLFQRGFGQTLDVHPGLLAEVGELPYQLGCTQSIFTEKLPCSTRAGSDHQGLPAAWTGHGQHIGIASGVVACNLGDDLVGLVDLNLIANTQLETLEDVQIVQIASGNLRTIDGHRLKQARDAHHTGSGGCQIHTEEPGLGQVILPFQCDHTVLVMAGGTQACTVDAVVILDDQAIHGVGIILRLIGCENSLKVFRTAVHIGVGNHGEACLLHQLHLSQLGSPFQMVTDQIKGKELQKPLARLICIQLSGAAGCQVPGMRIGLLQTRIDQLEMLPGDDAFTTDLDGFHARDGQRDIQVGANRMGHILTDDALTSTGNGLLELAILITQHDGQTIQLPGHPHRVATGKADHLRDSLGLGCGEHGLGVPHGSRLLQNIAGYLLGGRAGDHHTGFLLQPQKLCSHQVVFSVRHDGVVIPVVGNIGRLQPLD